jgi:hypothetical protein
MPMPRMPVLVNNPVVPGQGLVLVKLPEPVKLPELVKPIEPIKLVRPVPVTTLQPIDPVNPWVDSVSCHGR